MATMDVRINRLLMYSRVLERLLHDREGVLLEYGGMTVIAERFNNGETISVVGRFPEHCWLEKPRHVTILMPGEEVFEPVLVREIVPPGDGPFVVALSFAVSDMETASS